jgi:hypothetical protein
MVPHRMDNPERLEKICQIIREADPTTIVINHNEVSVSYGGLKFQMTYQQAPGSASPELSKLVRDFAESFPKTTGFLETAARRGVVLLSIVDPVTSTSIESYKWEGRSLPLEMKAGTAHLLPNHPLPLAYCAAYHKVGDDRRAQANAAYSEKLALGKEKLERLLEGIKVSHE